MATATPVPVPEPVPLERFEDMVRRMVDYYETLRSMKLGRMQAELALEYDREAKEVINIINSSPAAMQKKRLYEAHKVQSDIVNRALKPAEILSNLCKNIRSSYEVFRRQKVEAERRKREEEANQLALEQRRAELEHLQTIGKTAEAAVRAAEPIVPVTVNVDEDAGKPEGEMFVEVWAPKRDEQGKIRGPASFSDEMAFRKWLYESPDIWAEIVEYRYAPLKKLLTANRGMIQPPGLVVEHRFDPRTTREADE